MTSVKQQVLVTGGSGFVAAHCIHQLFQAGYKVRATLRSLDKLNDVNEMLREAGVTSFSDIEFVEADLTSDHNWDKAAAGCDYVLHVASPIYLRVPKNPDDMIRPAVDGTLRVLRAAKKAGVKRVVMTSNFGAVGYSHTDKTKVITEESWTDPDERGLSTYNKSKVLAERAAWNFMNNEGGSMELSVVNPMGIYGPALGNKMPTGYQLLAKLLDGSIKQVPNMTMGIVDVRDVADLHLRAMTNPSAKGQRFLALAGGIMSLPEIACLLREKVPELAKDVSTKRAPDWAVKLMALFNPTAKAIVPMLSRYREASNQKAKTLLGWQPRSNEEALLAAVKTLVKSGAIKKS